MRKSWGLTQKILSGEKTIESRWYMNRYKPWGNISRGDTVYFKDSGEPVKIQATVDKVIQFEDLTPSKVKEILNQYANAKVGGLGVNKENISSYFELFKNKRYCLLVFLSDPREIESFEIDRSGFGAMAAWLIVQDIEKIKKKWYNSFMKRVEDLQGIHGTFEGFLRHRSLGSNLFNTGG